MVKSWKVVEVMGGKNSAWGIRGTKNSGGTRRSPYVRGAWKVEATSSSIGTLRGLSHPFRGGIMSAKRETFKFQRNRSMILKITQPKFIGNF